MEAIPCLRKGDNWGLKISTLSGSTGLLRCMHKCLSSWRKKGFLGSEGQAEVGSISSDLCLCSPANQFPHQLV